MVSKAEVTLAYLVVYHLEYVHLSLKTLWTTAPTKAASVKRDFKNMLAFICSSLLQLNTKSEEISKNVLPTQTFFPHYCLSKYWKCSWRREQLQYKKLQICYLCSSNAGITRAQCYTFLQKEEFQEWAGRADFPAPLRKASTSGHMFINQQGHIFLVLQSSRRG